MRVSKPAGKRVERGNLKSNPQMKLIEDKKQPRNPYHDPDFDMQYGCSRRTGRKAGGYLYNPPAYCESPRIEIDSLNDSWVQVYFCKNKPCSRWASNTCPAKETLAKQRQNGYSTFDEPANRKPKRVERHEAARELREQVKPAPRRASVTEEAPRRRRIS